MQVLLTDWLLTALLHSTLLGLAALFLLRLTKDLWLRTWLLRLGLFGGLATAALQVSAGSRGTSALALNLSGETYVAVGLDQEPEGSAPAILALQSAESDTSQGLTQQAWSLGYSGTFDALRSRWRGLLLSLWALGVLVGLARFSWLRVRFLSGLDRAPLGDVRASAVLRAMESPASTGRIRLTSSVHVTSALALSRTEICVPRAGWKRLDSAEQQGLLAHELGHIVHRDPSWFLAAQIAQGLLFLQPLTRVLRHRLQLEAEYRADDWAQQRIDSPLCLARCLATVAAWPSALESQLLPGMAHERSKLVLRIERILGDPPARASRRVRKSFCAAASLGFLIFACSAPHVETSTVPTSDGAAEGAAIATIESARPKILVLNIAAGGIARFLEPLEARDLGSFDLESPSGREQLKGALAQAATDGPLHIQSERGTGFNYTKRVMELCGSPDLALWNIEISGAQEGDPIYPTPLAVDIQAVIEESEEGQDPPRRIDVRVQRQSNSRGPTGLGYTVFTRADSFPSQIQAGTDGNIRELPAGSLSALRAKLKYLFSFNPEVPVRIDARPGVFFDDVEGVLDAVISAGFTNLAFVGEYKR